MDVMNIFFMKVEDDYGDEIMVLISGENGSNFLSDIEQLILIQIQKVYFN